MFTCKNTTGASVLISAFLTIAGACAAVASDRDTATTARLLSANGLKQGGAHVRMVRERPRMDVVKRAADVCPADQSGASEMLYGYVIDDAAAVTGSQR